MKIRMKEIKVRLTVDELEDLNNKVAKTSLSREALIRCLILGYRPREQPSEEFFEVISQLRAIGNNLNQIAMVTNRSGYIDATAYQQEVMNLRKEILEIRKIVCEPVKIENGNNSDMGYKG